MRLAALVVLLELAGCTASEAPFVRDVRTGPDGRLEVERCSLRVTTYPILVNVLAPRMELRNCEVAPAGSAR